MWDRVRHVWLPRACFTVAFALALALAVAVAIAPWIPADDRPLVALFAESRGVRGAAIAGAIGLFVTACVFFRASGSRSEKPSPKEPPPGNMAGA